MVERALLVKVGFQIMHKSMCGHTVCIYIKANHSELLDVDAKIMNLNFNGLKLKFYLFIEQCEH